MSSLSPLPVHQPKSARPPARGWPRMIVSAICALLLVALLPLGAPVAQADGASCQSGSEPLPGQGPRARYAAAYMQALANHAASPSSVTLNPDVIPLFVDMLARQLDETGSVVSEGWMFPILAQFLTFAATPMESQRPENPFAYWSASLRAATASAVAEAAVVANGQLRVTLAPSGAVDAGAQWQRANTGIWRNSGYTDTDIAPGVQGVEFFDINDWIAPTNTTVTIVAGQLTTLDCDYVAEASPGALHSITANATPTDAGMVTCTPNPVEDGASSTCTAQANPGYQFSHWGGACSGTTCTLSNVTESLTVTGNFVEEGAPPPPLGMRYLNDTGIDWCANATNINLPCPVTGFPNQDAQFGRDALASAGTLPKIGAGAAGFDYTKLDAQGNALDASDSPWFCVRDNVTGLIWEVKTGANWLDTYTQAQASAYAAAVNNGQGLCGANDWRLPTRMELHSLSHLGVRRPTIDVDYFPNTNQSQYWSASRYAGAANLFWRMSFFDGRSGISSSGSSLNVRLVRQPVSD